MRKKRPIDRRQEHLRDTSLIVIASEDRYAVKQYFDLFRSVRVQVRVLETEDGLSSPGAVLGRLDDYIQEYDIGPDDSFWFVTDTDHWVEPGHIANLTRVIQECKQKKIGVAISNPCFDLWLLMHFSKGELPLAATCKEIGELLRSEVGYYDKKRIYGLPFTVDSVNEAVTRSRALFAEHEVIPVHLQSGVHLIIDQLVQRDALRLGTVD